jgi:transcriptional regulator with XRE-family HTH domain
MIVITGGHARSWVVMKTKLEALGLRIRQLRRERNISQEELAHRCALHRTYLSDLERGSRNISFLALSALAWGLGLSVSELTRGVETGGPESPFRTVPEVAAQKESLHHPLPGATERE